MVKLSKFEKYQSPLCQVTSLLHSSLSQLGSDVDLQRCETIGVALCSMMGARSRDFHRIDHALAIANSENPITVIAALFHDCVYHQVDASRCVRELELLAPFDPGESLEMEIPRDEVLRQDQWALALTVLFGFPSGKKLDQFTGLNEFLSAWVCLSLLREILPSWPLLQILAGIEATRPFRKASVGQSLAKALMGRLKLAADVLGLSPTAEDLRRTVEISTELANQDLMGFANPDPGEFLSHTWALIYESNPKLQDPAYTIGEYRVALEKMRNFFLGLDPENIFPSFGDVPPKDVLQDRIEMATRNIEMSQRYLESKLVDVTLLEAVAQVTGGDAPFEQFLGRPVVGWGGKEDPMARFLVLDEKRELRSENEKTLGRLLFEGRSSDSLFDSRASILTYFLYVSVGRRSFEELCEASRQYMQGSMTPDVYLSRFPRGVMHSIGEALTHIVWTRSAKMRSLLRLLEERRAG